jgi:hypothetical protein
MDAFSVSGTPCGILLFLNDLSLRIHQYIDLALDRSFFVILRMNRSGQFFFEATGPLALASQAGEVNLGAKAGNAVEPDEDML